MTVPTQGGIEHRYGWTLGKPCPACGDVLYAVDEMSPHCASCGGGGDDADEVIRRFLTQIPYRLSVGKGHTLFNSVLVEIEEIINHIKQLECLMELIVKVDLLMFM